MVTAAAVGSTRGGEASTLAEEAIKVVSATRAAAASRGEVASKGVASLLRAAGRAWELFVVAIEASKVMVINLVWEVVPISCKGKVAVRVYRVRDNGASMQARSGIDADLLQQTVQAVVAAVTAATKVSEPIQSAPPTVAHVDSLTGGTDQHAMMSVAAPNAVPQPTQGVQENLGAGAKGKDNEGQGPQKKKEEEKSGCFRCKQPGHYIDDCPTPFCDLCESVHHATPACHLHQAPKPTAILHGYANEALMFFELPCGAFKAKVENPKLAKVTVDGDAMTIPELIDQLKKIVPSDKFNWEVFHFKENIYRVKLPNFRCNLIPKNNDMFIRRGFFKLHFEVEEDNGSQEVDMAEVNNGNDGNDDAMENTTKRGVMPWIWIPKG
ncbi:hypothetical protein ACQ4PT_040841 [Festuca glaucescens]